MADSVAREILRILSGRKGASAFELLPAISQWGMTDDPSPVHLLLPSLAKLHDWGLLEVYDGAQLVEPTESSQLARYMYKHEVRFFLSPVAVAMADDLSLDLKRDYRPIFGQPIDKSWPNVFVLMSFSEQLRWLYDVHLKKVAARCDVTIARADDLFTTGPVIHDIWSAIYHARVVVSECTGRNANVFYETGIAHTLGRPTILVSQALDDIPFDLRHVRTIVYEQAGNGLVEFEERLTGTIRRCIAGLS